MPSSFDKEKLADTLRHDPILAQHATTSPDGEGRCINVRVDTLAADLHSPDQIATVCFPITPPALQTLESDGQLKIPVALYDPPVGTKPSPSSQGLNLTIDKHFCGTTVLYSPSDHDVDVLAISGLGGHAFGSFVHAWDGHMWLRDSLPQHKPRARVMVYGYNSGLQRSTRFDDLGDIAEMLRITIISLLRSAKRRLVLIGHSLGGLLIKEALVRIAESDSESDLIGLVSGVLFFGVPNDEMDIGPLILLANEPNRFLLESLQNTNSQTLVRQRRDFDDFLRRTDLNMFCFFETVLSPTVVRVSSLT